MPHDNAADVAQMDSHSRLGKPADVFLDSCLEMAIIREGIFGRQIQYP